MGSRFMTIFAAVQLAALVYILYETRFITKSSLAQRLNISAEKYETSTKFFSNDPSGEYDSTSRLAPPFDVMEALKRDGYSPVCVSVNSSMTRSDWDILLSKRYNLSEYKETIPVVDVSSNHSVKSNITRSQVSTSKNNSKSAQKLQSDIARIASNRTLSISTSKPEIGGGQSDYLKEANETQPVLKVPNVVHYVFLGSDLNFTFINYLSYRSVDRFIRPDQIFVHGDNIPKGMWWNRTINEIQNIYHVNRTYSDKAPNGQPFRYPAHISDYMRTEVLLRYGGIYLDSDVLVVKSFNDLRQFSFVIGREDSNGLCNGIMVAERGALFLRLILEQYQSYRGSNEAWAEKSVLNTDKLARLYPHLVHVEEKSLDRPNWREKELVQIYDGKYNWTQNYAVHTWIRLWPNEKRPNGVEGILTKNTTFGEISRLALFGSHDISKH